MIIQEMAEKITEIEKTRGVSIYMKYDTWTQCYSFMMDDRKRELTRNVPVTEIMTWSIDILERYLNQMAHDLEIGVMS